MFLNLVELLQRRIKLESTSVLFTSSQRYSLYFSDNFQQKTSGNIGGKGIFVRVMRKSLTSKLILLYHLKNIMFSSKILLKIKRN